MKRKRKRQPGQFLVRMSDEEHALVKAAAKIYRLQVPSFVVAASLESAQRILREANVDLCSQQET